MEELVQYSLWIDESLSSIRKKDVRVLIPEVDPEGNKTYKPSLTPLVLAYKAIAALQSAVCNHAPLTAVCGNIGKVVLMGNEAENASEADKAIARVNIGFHLINVLFNKKKLKERRGINKRDPYTIQILDDKFMDTMFYSVNAEPLKIAMHTKPIFEEPIPFTGFNHPIAGDLVHKCHPDAKKYFKYETCPTVFDTINKHMSTPYEVNTDLLKVYLECKPTDNLFTFRDKGYDNEQFVGIKREQTFILDIAQGVGDRRFWQYMFYDFRGRLYSSLIYFSPQGSKLAKSLFRMANKKPIGAEGWSWMLVHAANCFGEDKIPLNDRINFTNDRLDEWMVWAENPVKYKDWQLVDSPYEFLAAIMEIYKAIQHPNKYQYESGLLVAWDATCSGLQVLSALTRDEKSGILCNLVNSGKRGDYYQMIADHVWPECVYNELDVYTFNKVNTKLNDFKLRLEATNSRIIRSGIYEERKEWMDENREDVRSASRVFWGRKHIIDMSRKIVKRPCMTYFYSCGAKTMARSLYGDFKNEVGFENLHMTYCLWLTSRIYRACQELMPMATKMMDGFIDMGLADYRKKLDFTIVAPYNKFLLMQNYRNPLTKEVRFKCNGRSIRLKVMIGRGDTLEYKKIQSATSPNAVHMLDSQLVSSTIINADYDINCIHDSFATIPADAGKLFEDVRICFVNIFKEDILIQIEEEKGFITHIELGQLDIHDALEDDYCFN